MSEYQPKATSENDKNVLVPRSDGRIEVMRLSDRFDESGRQIAYRLDDDGQTVITKAGLPEAFSDQVQAHLANKLAMDRNPTPEQMERGTPPEVITGLGDVALEAAMNLSAPAEASDTGSVEQGSNLETGLNFQLLADEVSTLNYANESIRHLPEAEGRHNVNMHVMNKAGAVYDAFKDGKISEESYSIVTNALLGAASSHESIGAVVDMLRDARTLDADEMSDVSSQAGAISEIGMLSGMDGERARISFVNSLIAKSERLLEDNGGVASGRYKAMVGFIAGLSTQINDPSTSTGFTHGALNRLRQHTI
jgi:hypothetical protein